MSFLASSMDQLNVEDMTELERLDEEVIIRNLENRFKKDAIYTYVGSLLVSLNPLKDLPIYSISSMEQYCGRKHRNTETPHLFAISNETYLSLLSSQTSQSVLISGESGSGKTESTKYFIQYLTYASTQGHSGEKPLGNIEAQLLNANPILEAFGNARTIRNNNSSRFGKFIRVYFDFKGRISGCQIDRYLLEKSRVVVQSVSERSYHVFYQLVKGASPEAAKAYALLEPHQYLLLSRSGCTSIDGVDDAAQFSALKRSMSILGISEEQQSNVFSLLSAILHIGNIAFDNSREKSEVKNKHLLQIPAKLLGISPEKLEQALCTRPFQSASRKSFYKIPFRPGESEEAKQALCKGLYEYLFEWIVNQINLSMSKCSSSFSPSTQNYIGILDIFGFEWFEKNTFSQLLINYANEKLQQQFNDYIFKHEQKEYEREQIPWSTITFQDNMECVQLIEGKLGVLSLLDEECVFPKGTDMSYLEKLTAKHITHPNFGKPTPTLRNRDQIAGEFIIKHYAGPVSYSVDRILEYNKDNLFPHLIQLLKLESTNAFVKEITPDVSEVPAIPVTNSPTTMRPAKASSSLGGRFKAQLSFLSELLSQTSPHYIRCIKPNSILQENMFDSSSVRLQLRCSGIINATKVRKQGYFYRALFHDFYRRFFFLLPHTKLRDQEFCRFVLSKVAKGSDQWQIGQTKVFLKEHCYTNLEALRELKLSKTALFLQRRIRIWKARKIYNSLLAAKEQERQRILKEHEEKERAEQERRRREELERLERLRIEQERLEAERSAKEREEKERSEAEKIRKEEARRTLMELELEREKELRKQELEEQIRLETEKTRAEERARLVAETKKVQEEEMRRREEEARQREEETRRREEESRQREEEVRQREEEARRRETEKAKEVAVEYEKPLPSPRKREPKIESGSSSESSSPVITPRENKQSPAENKPTAEVVAVSSPQENKHATPERKDSTSSASSSPASTSPVITPRENKQSPAENKSQPVESEYEPDLKDLKKAVVAEDEYQWAKVESSKIERYLKSKAAKNPSALKATASTLISPSTVLLSDLDKLVAVVRAKNEPAIAPTVRAIISSMRTQCELGRELANFIGSGFTTLKKTENRLLNACEFMEKLSPTLVVATKQSYVEPSDKKRSELFRKVIKHAKRLNMIITHGHGIDEPEPPELKTTVSKSQRDISKSKKKSASKPKLSLDSIYSSKSKKDERALSPRKNESPPKSPKSQPVAATSATADAPSSPTLTEKSSDQSYFGSVKEKSSPKNPLPFRTHRSTPSKIDSPAGPPGNAASQLYLDRVEYSKALIGAAKSATLPLLDKYLAMGADINYVDENKMTALTWAVRSNSKECVERLLKDLNVNVNAQDIVLWTPLHYAVYLKYPAIVSLLLKHKSVDVFRTNNQGKKALDLVSNSKEISALFEAHKPISKVSVKTFKENVLQKDDGKTSSITSPSTPPVSITPTSSSEKEEEVISKPKTTVAVPQAKTSTKTNRRGKRSDMFRVSQINHETSSDQ
eukprot:TRINITY_DN344_c0_g2_i1.p1 TRINITY_DN344_c0_g2~~TRINITY_DN344_c0_g2_i1.p1  ORF type:complete len:1517 (+),score=469.87 TRINITY_DN344_c0_g2_i1:48-4598(+)